MKFIKTIYITISIIILFVVTYLSDVYSKSWILQLYFVLWTITTVILMLLYGGKIFMKKKKEDVSEPNKEDEKNVKEEKKQSDEEKQPDERLFTPGERGVLQKPETRLTDVNKGNDIPNKMELQPFNNPSEQDDSIDEVDNIEEEEKGKDKSKRTRMDRLVSEINELKEKLKAKEKELMVEIGIRD